MTVEENLKKDITFLITNVSCDIEKFYQEIMNLNGYDLFFIEKREISQRIMDLGPRKPFYLKFSDEKIEAVQKVIKLFNEVIDSSVNIKSVNKIRLLLLASVFEDHTHGKPLQERIYKNLSKESTFYLFKEIVDQFNNIDWKGNLDIQEKPSSIHDWDILFRAGGYLFRNSNLISVLIFAIKKIKETDFNESLSLVPLLKMRVILEISLNDYLSVFKDRDFDFFISYIFSRHTRSVQQANKAVDIIANEIVEYASDKDRFEELIKEIFTDYYYQNEDKDEVKSQALKIIAKQWINKIKDGTYSPDLGFKDYVIYPRGLYIFEKEQYEIDEKCISNHIVEMLMKSLSEENVFMDSHTSIKFPYELLSKNTQESYAFILHSILTCSEEKFEIFKRKIKNYIFAILPCFFGRYHAEKYAIQATTNLYLIFLSVTWLTDDIEKFKNRFESSLEILNDSLIEPYAYKMTSHLKNYDRDNSYPDDFNSFFAMMIQAAKTNNLNVQTLISTKIESQISLNWPWSISNE